MQTAQQNLVILLALLEVRGADNVQDCIHGLVMQFLFCFVLGFLGE